MRIGRATGRIWLRSRECIVGYEKMIMIPVMTEEGSFDDTF
jgi:hypothetical protein